MARSSTRATRPTVTLIVVALGVLAIYPLRLDRIAGLIIDDGWYALLGRALARGEGYSLVNSPVPGILPFYPPGFAALLSIVFRIAPSFPENVVLLKAVSIVAMMAVGIASYRYFTRDRGLSHQFALALAVAITITPGFVFLATSTLMSECVFTLIVLLAVIFADRSVSEAPSPWSLWCTAMLCAAAVLIRSAGIPVPVAVALYLLSKRRWRRAALFAAVVGLCLAPWLWYARVHGGQQSLSYGHQFWMRYAGTPSSGMVTVRDLPARAMDGLVDVFGRDIAGIVAPTLFRDTSESGEEVIALGGGAFHASMGSASGTMVLSFLLSALAVLGFVSTVRRGATAAEFVVPLSLGMIVLWPVWAYRFVLPLTPYLFFYLLTGLRTLTNSVPVARVAMLCVIGLNLLDHAQYIARSRVEVLDWATDAQEVDGLFEWMHQHVADDGYVATTNPPLVYLRTNRKTISIDDLEQDWQSWKSRGVRYVVCLRPTELPTHPYKMLYRSPKQGLWIISI